MKYKCVACNRPAVVKTPAFLCNTHAWRWKKKGTWDDAAFPKRPVRIRFFDAPSQDELMQLRMARRMFREGWEKQDESMIFEAHNLAMKVLDGLDKAKKV
jgi:hypothetical protein